MIIGVDVGPTNTDAVLLSDAPAVGGDTVAPAELVVAAAKVPTRPDDAVGSLADAVAALPAARTGATRLAVGLRVAARAVAERSGLARVGVLRIGGAAADSVRPLFGWPADLRDAVCAGYANVDGGTGLEPHSIIPLDRAAIARFGTELAGRADAFAVTGVFSPADGGQEREAAEILRAAAGPGVPVLLSGEIGSLGLLEREAATVLDAALSQLAARIADELTAVLPRLGLAPETAVLVTKQDGTAMSLDQLRRQPGPSLGAGPACTIRGAGLLAGVRDAVVADIGGRQARVAVLTGGFPQEVRGTSAAQRFPDLVTVDFAGTGAPGAASSGGHPPVPAAACREIADAADRMRPAAGRLPLLLVGGGAPGLPGRALAGFDVVRPEHGAVAGAFGAAASPVGGQYERIVRPGRSPGPGLDAVRDEVRELARAAAVRAGADPRRVRTDLDPDLPAPYLPGAVLLRARAFGPPMPL